MSKRPLRVIVVLFALAFSLAGTSVVTVARDGFAPVKKKVRPKKNKLRHETRTDNTTPKQEDPPDDRDPGKEFARNDVNNRGGNPIGEFFGGVAKVGRKVGRIISGKGSKSTNPNKGGGPRDTKTLDF